jgi:predicted CDP-diglyceride synthetase/phosphatidate cytidylyltransferase
MKKKTKKKQRRRIDLVSKLQLKLADDELVIMIVINMSVLELAEYAGILQNIIITNRIALYTRYVSMWYSFRLTQFNFYIIIIIIINTIINLLLLLLFIEAGFLFKD